MKIRNRPCVFTGWANGTQLSRHLVLKFARTAPIRTKSATEAARDVWPNSGRSGEVAPTQRLRAAGPAPAPRGQKSSLPVRVRRRDLVCGAIVRGNARSIEPKEVFKIKIFNFNFQTSSLSLKIFKLQVSNSTKFELQVCLGNFQTNLFVW